MPPIFLLLAENFEMRIDKLKGSDNFSLQVINILKC